MRLLLSRAKTAGTVAVARAMQRTIGPFEYWRRHSDRVHIELRDEPLKPSILLRGEQQFQFLKSLGVRPEHRLLDYGCAGLATGYWLIPYLEPGHYVGIDVGRALPARGVKRLNEAAVDRARYHVLTATDDLTELDGFSFDYIIAFSVFQYLRPEAFPFVLSRLFDLLNEGGKLCASFSDAVSKEELTGKGMYCYELDEYRRHLVGGLSIETNQAGRPVAIFTKRSNAAEDPSNLDLLHERIGS